jgi:hypothetical protein
MHEIELAEHVEIRAGKGGNRVIGAIRTFRVGTRVRVVQTPETKKLGIANKDGTVLKIFHSRSGSRNDSYGVDIIDGEFMSLLGSILERRT